MLFVKISPTKTHPTPQIGVNCSCFVLKQVLVLSKTHSPTKTHPTPTHPAHSIPHLKLVWIVGCPQVTEPRPCLLLSGAIIRWFLLSLQGILLAVPLFIVISKYFLREKRVSKWLQFFHGNGKENWLLEGILFPFVYISLSSFSVLCMHPIMVVSKFHKINKNYLKMFQKR